MAWLNPAACADIGFALRVNSASRCSGYCLSEQSQPLAAIASHRQLCMLCYFIFFFFQNVLDTFYTYYYWSILRTRGRPFIVYIFSKKYSLNIRIKFLMLETNCHIFGTSNILSCMRKVIMISVIIRLSIGQYYS